MRSSNNNLDSFSCWFSNDSLDCDGSSSWGAGLLNDSDLLWLSDDSLDGNGSSDWSSNSESSLWNVYGLLDLEASLNSKDWSILSDDSDLLRNDNSADGLSWSASRSLDDSDLVLLNGDSWLDNSVDLGWSSFELAISRRVLLQDVFG